MSIKFFPRNGFWWILDMLFYETSATNGAKIGYTFFFSRLGPFFCYFYPSNSIYATTAVCEIGRFWGRFWTTFRSPTIINPIDLDSLDLPSYDAVDRMSNFEIVWFLWLSENGHFWARKCIIFLSSFFVRDLVPPTFRPLLIELA